jgi:predicted ATP-dependent serine protease
MIPASREYDRQKGATKLSSDNSELDDLLGGGFTPQTLYLLYGERSPIRRIFLSLSVTAQLPASLNGFDSEVIYVDGDVSFDPYFISQKAIIKKLNPNLTLSRILISRSFTWEQMVDIVINKMKGLDARLLLISGLTSMFDPTTRSCFGDLLKILGNLKKFALEKNAVIEISTGYAQNSRFKPAGGKIMSHYADIIVNVSDYKNRVEFYRYKGGRPQKNIQWKSSPVPLQRNLNHWLGK